MERLWNSITLRKPEDGGALFSETKSQKTSITYDYSLQVTNTAFAALLVTSSSRGPSSAPGPRFLQAGRHHTPTPYICNRSFKRTALGENTSANRPIVALRSLDVS
jgi:hypothetical protein